MTDINRLRVSLTKHGAHKIFVLLENFQPDDVLKNTWDTFKGVRIDRAQARKNLSSFAGDKLPGFWADAKSRGADTLRQLVFLAIAFSHHELISALSKGSTGSGRGIIRRADLGGGKAFTNFKNDLEELGLAKKADANSVSYDLGKLYTNPQLGDLAAQLFALKLSEANWKGSPSLADECVRLGFHDAMSLSEGDFRRWLSAPGSAVRDEDELPDVKDADQEAISTFVFRAGHVPKMGGVVAKRGVGSTSARLIHNEIQSVLFDTLVATHGKSNVGTELSTGSATSVDLVVRSGSNFEFYEIKTSPSLKKCLRQALSQLIEYAYWPTAKRASKLVLVAEAHPTRDAQKYLKHLRDLGIPIAYRQVDRAARTLSKEF